MNTTATRPSVRVNGNTLTLAVDDIELDIPVQRCQIWRPTFCLHTVGISYVSYREAQPLADVLNLSMLDCPIIDGEEVIVVQGYNAPKDGPFDLKECHYWNRRWRQAQMSRGSSCKSIRPSATEKVRSAQNIVETEDRCKPQFQRLDRHFANTGGSVVNDDFDMRLKGRGYPSPD